MEGAKKEDVLFSEFPPISMEEWKEKVIADLKGADFDKKLVWNTLEGFDLQPLYTKDDLEGIAYLQNYQNRVISQKGTGLRAWDNREKILVKDETVANTDALNALNRGADGILLDLTKSPNADIAKVLKGVDPTCCSVSFEVSKGVTKVVDQFIAFVTNGGFDLSKVSGSLIYGPLKQYATTGTKEADAFTQLADAISKTQKAKDFKVVSISSEPFQNAGAAINQEIGFTLNALVEYIEQLTTAGATLQDVVENIEFQLAIGTSYFAEIAKIRSLRILTYQVLKQYGLEVDPGAIAVYSHSSIWSKTVYDPYVNMLRNTTEAMSAIIGGCNAITIAPYNETFAISNEFSRRISRNVANMLKEESYFDKVVDPSAGSYYIEIFTDKLVQASLEIFQAIEAKGGFIAALEAGAIQDAVKAVRDEKMKRVSQRRQIIVGNNAYPNAKEKIDPDALVKESVAGAGAFKLLTPESGASEVEELRAKTERYAKANGEDKRPTVYLSLFGAVASMRTARSMFSGGFLGCGGFNIVEGKAIVSVEEAAKAAIDSGAEIIVMCAADDDYVNDGEAFTKIVKGASANTIVIVAGNPAEAVEKLQAAGVDDFIHMRKDLLSTLAAIQQKLGVK